RQPPRPPPFPYTTLFRSTEFHPTGPTTPSSRAGPQWIIRPCEHSSSGVQLFQSGASDAAHRVSPYWAHHFLRSRWTSSDSRPSKPSFPGDSAKTRFFHTSHRVEPRHNALSCLPLSTNVKHPLSSG